MAYEEFKRVLDQIRLTPQREDAMLSALLTEERTEANMKTRRRLPRLAAVALAAALALTVGAFAVVTGLDGRLLTYFGGTPETGSLLSPAAVVVDKKIKSHGSTLHVRQLIADRYSAVILMDFTAPEGTALDGDYYAMETHIRGEAADGGKLSAWGSEWKLLEDEAPGDNCIPLLLRVDFIDGDPKSLGAGLTVELEGLYSDRARQNNVLEGNWSFRVTLPETDPGRYTAPEAPVMLEDVPTTLTSLYVSPITVAWTLEQKEGEYTAEHWGDETFWAEELSLVLTDGRTLAPEEMSYRSFDVGMRKCLYCFRLPEIIDPAEIVSVSIFGQDFEITK